MLMKIVGTAIASARRSRSGTNAHGANMFQYQVLRSCSLARCHVLVGMAHGVEGDLRSGSLPEVAEEAVVERTDAVLRAGMSTRVAKKKYAVDAHATIAPVAGRRGTR